MVMDENSHIRSDFGVGESVLVAGNSNNGFDPIYAEVKIGNIEVHGYDVDNGSQSSQRTKISIGFSNVTDDFYHSFVIATDPITGDQHAVRAGPSSGFGVIRAEQGIYNDSFRDPPSLLHTTQQVEFINAPFINVVAWAVEFTNVKNANNLPYKVLTLISNSFPFTFVESLGLGRPKPLVPVPGWRSGRPDPSLSYLKQIQSAP